MGITYIEAKSEQQEKKQKKNTSFCVEDHNIGKNDFQIKNIIMLMTDFIEIDSVLYP